MRNHEPDMEIVKRAARSTICPHCPLRWGPPRKSLDEPSVCELECDLFKHLLAIRRTAACADPMLRSIPRAAAEAIELRVDKRRRFSSPLWRNRNRLVSFVTRLFGG